MFLILIHIKSNNTCWSHICGLSDKFWIHKLKQIKKKKKLNSK